MINYNYIELCAGCGGLSSGLINRIFKTEQDILGASFYRVFIDGSPSSVFYNVDPLLKTITFSIPISYLSIVLDHMMKPPYIAHENKEAFSVFDKDGNGFLDAIGKS